VTCHAISWLYQSQHGVLLTCSPVSDVLLTRGVLVSDHIAINQKRHTTRHGDSIACAIDGLLVDEGLLGCRSRQGSEEDEAQLDQQ